VEINFDFIRDHQLSDYLESLSRPIDADEVDVDNGIEYSTWQEVHDYCIKMGWIEPQKIK